MNKQRRKQIDQIITRLQDELAPLIDSIREEIETIRDEEQEYYDNMPESLQSGDKGDVAQSAIEALEEGVNTLEEIDIDSIITSLNTAQE